MHCQRALRLLIGLVAPYLWDMSSPLSQRLRTETAPSHRLAERSGIMRDILHGRITRSEYVGLLADLLVVYLALEGALESHAASPLVAPFDFAALARAPAIADDLGALLARESDVGVAWPVSPAAQAYAAAIAAADAPELVAHAYVRYLGDLSGGQVLRKIIGRALTLEGESGLTFYSFPLIADLPAFKDRFRESLDALPLTDSESDRLVAEAVRGFALNISLFEAAETRRPSSAGPRPPLDA